ncbi:DUF6979 family protein [Tepidibacter thalassicus]|uniref:Uncharacterized protein n=1 Tax=Tepidibacter thalassicus DSM 15285 TaxID=1123350 RepID=A0A1M5STY3_9FIRM|nr:hypothetical protein [Tepidibacter thalassicus]SHH41964.1 hypothetical protein SAMN02744040_01904 [Tepidibacter thalassicus DSM 15285]
MSKYEKCAIKAINLIKSGKINNPRNAWERASSEIFGKGTTGQLKGCPKSAFLGLCEEGIIKGISHGKYTKSKKNKNYAIKAIKILLKEPYLKNNKKELWNRVIENNKISHNYQMDVVIALWNNNLINKENLK